MTNNKVSIFEQSKDSRKEVIDSFLGEFPVLGTVVIAAQHALDLKRLYSLKTFIEESEVDATYLSSLAKDDKEQDVFLEYVQAATKTYNSVACVALALIYKDEKISNYQKITSAKSLIGIGEELTEFLLSPELAHIERLEPDKRNVLLSAFFQDNISSYNATSELIQRMICSKSTSIGDQGQTVLFTDYTLYIISNLKSAKALLSNG